MGTISLDQALETLLRPVELALEANATPRISAGVLDWKGVRARRRPDRRSRLVEVNGRRLACDHIIIATGSQPAIPSIDGLDECTVWTKPRGHQPARDPATGGPGGRKRG